ncbi:MAG: GNAT family protein [Aggregatilineales bacterium]
MDVFQEFPIIETDRLCLRRITVDDTSAWAVVFEHPDVTRFLVDFDTSISTRQAVEEIIQWADTIYEKRMGIRWAITLKADDAFIGSCGFHLYSAHNRCAEIGYELHRDHWQQGIMTEALMSVLQFGFEFLKLHRIEANVTAGNLASAGLLRRFGFTMEGTWRDKVFADGKFHDLWQFSILENEMRQAKS